MRKIGIMGFGLALLLLAAGCGPLPPLQLRLEPDGSQSYRAYIDTYEHFRAKGQYYPRNETHLIFDWEQAILPAVQPDSHRVQLVFRRIQMQEDTLEKQGGSRFDTEQVDQAAAAAYRPFYGMLDKPLILTIDRLGAVVNVEGFAAVESAMAGFLPPNEQPERWKPYFRMLFGPDFLADLYEPFLTAYPLAEDRGKAQWQRPRTLYSSLIGKLSFEQKIQLADPKERIAPIRFEGLIHAQPSERGQGTPDTGVVGEDQKPDMHQGKVSGALGLDRKTGLLEEYSQEAVLYTIDGDNPRGKPFRRLTIITHVERR